MMPRVRAPELPQNSTWFNTDTPLSIKQLKGRVVILDFWTYCCINCLHILPELKYLEQKYKDSLTVIGVHSAKFDNEKETENIRQAILRYDIEHPVVVDSGFRVWQEYTVRAWPTLMIIDPQGYVIGYVSGEGHCDALDESLEKLISEHQEKGTINFQELSLNLEKQRQPLITPLAFPGKVLATSAGLFIADSGHHRLVMSSLEGEIIQIIGTGKSGLTDGNFSEAEFSSPQGMAFDTDHQILYVADTENHALRRVDLQRQVVETIAGTGEQSRNIRPDGGVGLSTKLNSPWDLVKVGNTLFIAMAGPHQIWEMNLENGVIKTYAGTGAEGCVDGSLNESAFAQPSGITSNGEELYIADSEISSIRGVGIIEPRVVRTLCGSGDLFGFGDVDGQGENVRLQHCLGVEYAENFLWVADTYNHKIKLVSPSTGNCQTILGDGVIGLQDGQGKNSRFFEPSGLSVMGSKLYIADTNNHAIRCVDLNSFEVTTLQFQGLCAPDVCVPSNF
ncbi:MULTISPECIES: thioredoxin-like domain-containing protein [unclassified Tolypothrix]|uniref:thioredoxin-like domain-containing protein n=1 Tax=unclassified Tolypothrix TaxID=2649714 RepID=UPI0005EABFC6|nr:MULTISPECIES: thioredoxin-like domain-containing protein [unclassified Tolypothrix]BAY88829.1 redoxin domain-containing protein [Microchaete diplosiphon NIES-3275]EKF02758.1 TlpA family protein [Tolypothrix sp. PCC 7601]MBE9083762.1 redoxin domain-containing protein [Tolypothrix sp. LEGE 11397]UYD29477.1 redoxin domain-containing protein [Tolypothrix sp. PCC 7712]UYD34611.1 redoxin domain-containing protein [Tolypothrix sp. PCC 7601]